MTDVKLDVIPATNKSKYFMLLFLRFKFSPVSGAQSARGFGMLKGKGGKPMEWNIIVGLVCTALGAAVSYATFTRNKGKDDRSDGQQIGTVLTELGYIKSNTDEIKAEQREQRKVNTTVEGRLAAVESSAKSAHHRIDRLEGAAHEEA